MIIYIKLSKLKVVNEYKKEWPRNKLISSKNKNKNNKLVAGKRIKNVIVI